MPGVLNSGPVSTNGMSERFKAACERAGMHEMSARSGRMGLANEAMMVGAAVNSLTGPAVCPTEVLELVQAQLFHKNLSGEDRRAQGTEEEGP